MINVGVIGHGYWGPNLVRNFFETQGVRVSHVSDLNENKLIQVESRYPSIKITTNADEIIKNSKVDAIVVATPVSTHYELALKALENGKHIFVAKPFTSSASEGEKLIELAEKKDLKIMVDHTFLFTGAVRKIKELIDNNVLGNLYYYDSTRINLGLFQHDINVIWDLAPHDFAIMDYVIKEKPIALSTTGAVHFDSGFEDIAYITIYFDNNLIAHFNVNWLSPVKVRTTLIGGEDKMLLWNDLDSDEKVKVYDKGVSVETKEDMYNLLVDYRSGDMWSPRTATKEALKVEAEYFIDCIMNNKIPINDGLSGLRVVKMLEASNKSLKNKGKLIEL